MSAEAISIRGTNAAPRLRITRKRVIGTVLILLGIAMLIQGNSTLEGAERTILTFEAGANADVPHIIVPTLAFLNITALLYILAGAMGIYDPPKYIRLTNTLLVACGILLIPASLIAGAVGKSTNATTMVAETFRLATPISIGAMAGLWCERSGVINIAIEGMMLFSACFGFTALYFLRDIMPDSIGTAQFIAVLIAVGTGGLVALLHAWLSVTFRTDQIISGTVINILAVGTTSFIRREYLASTEGGLVKLPKIAIPVLSDIPIIGEPFFEQQPIFYMMFVIVIVSHITLFYTRWGLRVRAVGEHPHAADTLGIKVNRTRWISVFIGGMLAGLAGAWFSLEISGRFIDNLTRGAGFISLAALIFGKWTPFGAFGGGILFGFSDSLGTRFQILEVPVPLQFIQMVPYLVTIIVLAGLIGRAQAPKAIGKPYVKE